MRSSVRFMILVVVVACTAAAKPVAQGAPRPAAPRIGVFDSRALAIAYYNSDAHRAQMRAMIEELKTAKAAGDAAAVQRLEFKGPALQNLAHYQGFSTASVPNVLEAIKDAVPQVAKTANVSMIVSKWEVAWRSPDVEYLDVTDQLVAALHPDAKVLKWIADSRNRAPLPLVEAVTTLRRE